MKTRLDNPKHAAVKTLARKHGLKPIRLSGGKYCWGLQKDDLHEDYRIWVLVKKFTEEDNPMHLDDWCEVLWSDNEGETLELGHYGKVEDCIKYMLEEHRDFRNQ